MRRAPTAIADHRLGAIAMRQVAAQKPVDGVLIELPQRQTALAQPSSQMGYASKITACGTRGVATLPQTR